MVGTLLMRGMLVGLIAGLLAFGFAKLFGEPQVDLAIAFEAQMSAAKGEVADYELVSRDVQSTLGLLTGIVVYSTSIGGLFALVFAYLLGRVEAVSPQSLAALLAFAGFLAVIFVPGLKYPANPPSVGDPETIQYRTALFFVMISISIATMVAAINLGVRLRRRIGDWGAAVTSGVGFIFVIALVQALLPDINEVPGDFPAVVLWRFREAALGIQFIMWASVGLLFGWLTERSMRSQFRFANWHQRLSRSRKR